MFKQCSYMIFVVGRIHKNQIKAAGRDRQGKRPAENIQPEYMGLSKKPAMVDIMLYNAAGCGRLVHKYGTECSPAQCLKAKCTGAGKQIQNQGIFYPRSQDIEYRFFDPVGCGPDFHTFGRNKFSASAGAADDPH